MFRYSVKNKKRGKFKIVCSDEVLLMEGENPGK